MPTYDYKCTHCENMFSVFQKMSDNSIEKCNKCNGNVNRIISGGSGMIFKGTGFYLTDYGKSGDSKKNKQVSNSKSKEGDKNE